MKAQPTYIAFDADAVQDEVNSNLHTFRQLQEWQKNHPDRFESFPGAHGGGGKSIGHCQSCHKHREPHTQLADFTLCQSFPFTCYYCLCRSDGTRRRKHRKILDLASQQTS